MNELAYYLHRIDPFIFRITETFGPRWYGMAYVLAFVSGYFVLSWLAKKGYADLHVAQVGDFIFWAAIFGVMLGGRLGYIFFYRPEMLADPASMLRVWEGGMSAHGGIAGLVLFTLYYSRKYKTSWTNLGDNLCVTAPIGLFLGRGANFINGELYGRLTNVSWAMQFPKELLEPRNDAAAEHIVALSRQVDPAIKTPEAVLRALNDHPQIEPILRSNLTPRHPSQLYEALLEGVLLFLILWLVRTRIRTPNGVITGLFMCGYAVLRSVAEFFREPDAGFVGPLTRGQFFSVFLFALGLAFIIVAYLRPSYPRKL